MVVLLGRMLSVVLLASFMLSGDTLAAKPATYKRVDSSMLVEFQERYRGRDRSWDTVIRLQKWIETEEKRRGREEVVGRLRELQNEWRAMSARMDGRLQKVTARAERDAVYRRWAQVFRVIATIAGLAAEIKQDSESPKAGQTAGDRRDMEKGPLPPEPNPEEGQVMMETSAKQTVYQAKNGEWRRVDVQGFTERQIYSALGEDGNPSLVEGHAGSSSAGLAESVLRGMGDTARAYLGTLRQEGAVPYCSDRWGGCILVEEYGGDGWQPAEVLTEVPRGNLKRPPREQEKNLYRAIMGIMTPAVVGSMAIDVTPVAGEVKSAVELWTGRDPITGENVSPALALVGVLPMVGGRVKGALKAGQSVSKIIDGVKWEIPRTLRKKFRKILVVLQEEGLSKLQKVRIVGTKADVEIRSVDGTVRRFENKFIHFTSVTNARKIAKDGKIKAAIGPDGSKRVYALENESKTLLRTAREITDRIMKHKSKGEAAILFNSRSVTKKNNLKSGALEWIFTDDIGLEEGAVILWKGSSN